MRHEVRSVPVVTAPFGLTLGGGAEMAMHGAAARAHCELYMGLVEARRGLIPAGGGCKGCCARPRPTCRTDGGPVSGFVQAHLMNIAMGKVSMSAESARRWATLTRRDQVTLNRDYLTSTTPRRRCSAWPAPATPAPRERTFRLPGESGYATLRSTLQSMKERTRFSGARRQGRLQARLGALWRRTGPAVRVTEQHVLDLSARPSSRCVARPRPRSGCSTCS